MSPKVLRRVFTFRDFADLVARDRRTRLNLLPALVRVRGFSRSQRRPLASRGLRPAAPRTRPRRRK